MRSFKSEKSALIWFGIDEAYGGSEICQWIRGFERLAMQIQLESKAIEGKTAGQS